MAEDNWKIKFAKTKGSHLTEGSAKKTDGCERSEEREIQENQKGKEKGNNVTKKGGGGGQKKGTRKKTSSKSKEKERAARDRRDRGKTKGRKPSSQ